MKRFLLMGLLAASVGLFFDSVASAWPLRLDRYSGSNRTGRVRGYWMSPTTGPLYDYSAYFAARYPYLPGAGEYQWNPPYGNAPYGSFGTSVAILPAAPPPPRVTAGQGTPATTTPAPTTPNSQPK